MRYLNLACGDHFIVSQLWENCDFAPQSKQVRQVDLLKKLPYKNDSFDVVYCSHFIEHLHLDMIQNFFSECQRVLKPKGLIRIVLPDFENIAREYLKNIDSGHYKLSAFNIVEMIDQCVRNRSGGSMSEWYAKANNDPELISYINTRVGREFKNIQTERRSRPRIFLRDSFFNRLKRITFYKLKFKIQLKIIYFIVSLFPRWFRYNHILKTVTGERHLWVHDFNSILNFLHSSGFSDISKVDAHTSFVPNFPLFPLDLNQDGRSRKGSESMYIEAWKR